MNDNDYIVMIDENGQPYLAHAFGDGVRNFASTVNRKIRNNVGKGNRYNYKEHKYKERVDNYYGNGKHLYLYTDDEVRAFHGQNGNQRGSRTLSNRIRDKLGYDERIARDEARAKSDSSIGAGIRYKSAQDAYNKTALGKLENLSNAVKKRAKTTLGTIRKAGKWLDDHDAGLTETVRYAAKRNKVDEDERKQLHREMVEGGKIGRLANRVGESNTAHRITEAAYNPGQAARNVGASIGNAARNAGNAVKNAPQNIASTARNAAGNISSIIDERITGNSAQQAMSSSGQNALMGLDGAAAEYVDAVNKYNNSLEGATKNGLNSAVTKAKDSLDKARSSLQSAWKSASNYLTKDQRAAAQAEIDTMMGLDGSIGEWYDTHKVK